MERILKVNAPSVVGEIIDGEAVIMNLASGHYFSTQDSGCEIWRGIELQQSRSALVESLVRLYDVSVDEAERAVATFVSELLERELVVEADARGPSPPAAPAPSPGSPIRATFVAPVLNAYTDMEELLLLDPIHDVDDIGWPMPKVS